MIVIDTSKPSSRLVLTSLGMWSRLAPSRVDTTRARRPPRGRPPPVDPQYTVTNPPARARLVCVCWVWFARVAPIARWTWKAYHDECRLVAQAFLALGLARFDSVAIYGFNAPEWLISEVTNRYKPLQTGSSDKHQLVDHGHTRTTRRSRPMVVVVCRHI